MELHCEEAVCERIIKYITSLAEVSTSEIKKLKNKKITKSRTLNLETM